MTIVLKSHQGGRGRGERGEGRSSKEGGGGEEGEGAEQKATDGSGAKFDSDEAHREARHLRGINPEE